MPSSSKYIYKWQKINNKEIINYYCNQVCGLQELDFALLNYSLNCTPITITNNNNMNNNIIIIIIIIIIIKDFYSAHARVQSAVQLYMNRKDEIKMTKTTN